MYWCDNLFYISIVTNLIKLTFLFVLTALIMTDNGKKSPSSNEFTYNLQDLYKIIQVQQNTINKLNSEISKKSHSVSRELYEKSLNDYEVNINCFAFCI